MDENLKEKLGLDPEKPIPADYNIPYFVYEDQVGRLEISHNKESKFKNTLIFVLLAILVVSNSLWLYHESQFEDVVTETYTAETDQGGTAIANGDGSVVVNGESDLHENN